MTRTAMSILATTFCLALANCAGGDKPESVASAALSVDEMKSLVLSERGRIWKDPDSVRDAQIGNPYSCSGGLAHIGGMPNVCVCVSANARNGFGGYTGIKRTELLLNNRNIVDMISPPREPTYSCGPMVPFPELNGNFAPQPPGAAPGTETKNKGRHT